MTLNPFGVRPVYRTRGFSEDIVVANLRIEEAVELWGVRVLERVASRRAAVELKNLDISSTGVRA